MAERLKFRSKPAKGNPVCTLMREPHTLPKRVFSLKKRIEFLKTTELHVRSRQNGDEDRKSNATQAFYSLSSDVDRKIECHTDTLLRHDCIHFWCSLVFYGPSTRGLYLSKSWWIGMFSEFCGLLWRPQMGKSTGDDGWNDLRNVIVAESLATICD